jgi:putative transposase
MSRRKKEPEKELNLQRSPVNVDEVQPGRLFEWNGSLVEVRSRLGNLCQVIDIHTGASSAVEANVLSRPTQNKSRAVGLEHVSPKDWARAKQIAAVASQLLADHVTDPMVIQRAAKPLGIGERQMGRWMNNYRESGGLTSSCLARRPGQKRGAVLLTREQQSAIESAIEMCTKKPEATSLKEIMREVKTRAKELKSNPPSKESVLRRLDARGIRLSKRKHFGPEKAKEANNFKPGRNVASAPLEQVQIDHTQVDVMVLDDTRTYALGRPWLTLVICVFTRLILGFYLSLKAPSMVSVGRALTVAVSPKEKLLRLFGIKCRGPPGENLARY